MMETRGMFGAFADDVLIKARHGEVFRFAEILQPVLEVIHSCAKDCNLDFSYDKKYTLISRKGKLNCLPSCPIKLNGHRDKWTENLTYSQQQNCSST